MKTESPSIMRIGFDAKRAFSNNTGLGHYSRNLLRALTEFYPDNHYVLYTPRNPKRDDLPFVEEKPNVSIVTPGAWHERVAPSIWRSFLMTRNLKRNELDVYHGLSHELPVGIGSVPVKKVVTIHDLIFLRHPSLYSVIDRTIYKLKFKHACGVADVVIAVSRQTESDLIQLLNVPPEKIRVVYQSANPQYANPVDADMKERVRRKHRLPTSFILSVGSIIERKNLLSVVKALNILKISLDPFLVVVGQGGSYEKKVRAFVEENGLSSRVLFLGSVPQEDLVALYQMADVFVYPSLFEGFGIPIIEAIMSGVPVVTSRGSCFSESAGPESFLVDPFSTEELAESIKNILSERTLRDRMIKAGHEHAKLFDPKKLSAQMVQVYQSLL